MSQPGTIQLRRGRHWRLYERIAVPALVAALFAGCGADAEPRAGRPSPPAADARTDACPASARDEPLTTSIRAGRLIVRHGACRRDLKLEGRSFSGLHAFSLSAGGVEDAVVAHGRDGVLIAGWRAGAVERLWGSAPPSYDVSDFAIAGPWRHSHHIVDVAGDRRREVLTTAVRHMDVGNERKISTLQWEDSAFAPVESGRATSWHRRASRADTAAIENAIANRLAPGADATVRLIARADTASRALLGQGNGGAMKHWGRGASVRIGTDVAYLVRVTGDARAAVAHLAVVRTVPADKLEVLGTRELGPYPVPRSATGCAAGFDDAASVRVAAWNGDARALIARYYSDAHALSARAVRWDGDTLGPALEAIELARCDGPMRQLQLRSRGAGRAPAVRAIERP